jgi:restriction endonuclease S subunit
MPLYFEFKLIVLIILQNTTLKIPSLIYVKFVRPILQPFEPAIDEWLSRSYLNMITGLVNGAQYLVQHGPAIFATISAALQAATEAAQRTAREEHQKKLLRKETHAALNHQKTN